MDSQNVDRKGRLSDRYQWCYYQEVKLSRRAESLLLQRLEQMMRSLKEEISHRVDARLEELLSPSEDQQEERR